MRIGTSEEKKHGSGLVPLVLGGSSCPKEKKDHGYQPSNTTIHEKSNRANPMHE